VFLTDILLASSARDAAFPGVIRRSAGMGMGDVIRPGAVFCEEKLRGVMQSNINHA
jgi:hypothetical protein